MVTSEQSLVNKVYGERYHTNLKQLDNLSKNKLRKRNIPRLKIFESLQNAMSFNETKYT